MKKLKIKRDTTTMRIEKSIMEKLHHVAVADKTTPAKWIHWVVSQAYECIRPAEKIGDPFKTWGRSVAPKGELPPGYSDNDTN